MFAAENRQFPMPTGEIKQRRCETRVSRKSSVFAVIRVRRSFLTLRCQRVGEIRVSARRWPRTSSIVRIPVDGVSHSPVARRTGPQLDWPAPSGRFPRPCRTEKRPGAPPVAEECPSDLRAIRLTSVRRNVRRLKGHRTIGSAGYFFFLLPRLLEAFGFGAGFELTARFERSAARAARC